MSSITKAEANVNPQILQAMLVAEFEGMLPALIARSVKRLTKASQRVRAVKEPKIGVPREGTKCREVWNALDEMVRDHKEINLRSVTELADDRGWNSNNTRTEFYRWRAARAATPCTEQRKVERRTFSADVEHEHRHGERRQAA